MKSLKLVLIAAAAVAASGCTPDWATQNESGFILEIAGIEGSSGQGGEIRSDVLTSGRVFNDDAVVAVNVLRKNNNVDLGTSPVEHVYLDRYEVVYFRTDGRNTEGVDVPYRITGPLGNLRFHTAGPGGGGEVEQTVNITIVRQTAKLEPPLSHLQNVFASNPGEPTSPLQLPGEGLITTVAEITIHGHTIQGDGLQARGRVQVTFGDLPMRAEAKVRATMTASMFRGTRTTRALACLGIGATLALAGCGLDGVDIPDLDGPSTFGQALLLTVSPDLVVADGLSTAVVAAELRDQNGAPLADRDVFFAIADEGGQFADIGTLFDLAGNQLGGSEAIIRTDGSGIARIIYRTPPRTDATANQSILVTARPLGNDSNGAFYRTVRLELRSAEPRLFPQVPGNDPPLCDFIIETPDGARPGRSILFQTTSSDPDGTIVRYEWFFGDGTGPVYFPDTNHVYGFAGSFVVTHMVTDDDGAQVACTATVPIF